jgi:hypothetical protein
LFVSDGPLAAGIQDGGNPVKVLRVERNANLGVTALQGSDGGDRQESSE